ncbi:type VI secretion system contractile sheath domain-containing protein [Phaeobacter gallaeciensis]|nr:type VI secretion system contractile sheath large subunit [Phaeobacter gallaeciensis]MDE4193054.1 type VI secretion system contractile sheath large subunit [Phaeobacter gallaeciensis]MDE4201393.1 type VI secretion system contractile sheath large subunit [Phaeobacter gallaeciensis]MDE4205578.1 type VI secretion system contractile sheath large subunit [Phaeobacter gallaeciensis]MDE4209716.1 type VI secretion system contractile sheath large subunit [Phaeobacter gallaeciensis]MDE4218084.1 type 
MQEEDDLAALLQDATEVQEPEDAPDDDLAALLADDDEEVSEAEPSDADFDLDALLADETSDDSGEAEDAAEEAAGDDLDDLLSGFEEDASDDADEDDLDSLLAGLGDEASEEKEPDEITDEAEDSDDLDALLTDLDDPGDDLDALLAGEETADTDGDDDLDDLLAGLGSEDEDAGGDDLDDLLGDLTADETAKEEVAPPAAAEAEADKDPEFAFGTLSADRPEPQKLVRKRFRLALFGDFSGRAARGIVETGDALAARKAVLLDPDTVEDVIESFATELVLPIGKDGAGIAVKLGTLDDLHPDELFENVALFSELVGLRKQLQSGATADHAVTTLRAWAEKHGTRAHAPKTRSAGSSVPADRRLSAFQQLIGDTGNALRQASPVEEMLARIVGPHIRALPDPDVAAMQVAVDEALSDAMRLVLHHPEFQSVEAQWRALDLIARSVEVDDSLEVMLYDVSAEELAADLAAADDLTQSGFARLLTEEPLDEENGRGGYSALIGLYGFEETPPHAELLGRIARVAAHVDAPLFAAMSPAFLAVPKKERPKLVAEAWDTLQGMSEAGHLGLVSPRFLLRRPYGAKSDPIYEFDFEEFTEAEGLRGMLWANPVVLVAILLARSFKANGAAMQLGSIMSLGGMPYHYVNDRFGDQVALPCTERNIDLDKIAMANERGFMAIAAVKGRDELRLTSFQSVKGGEILGPWTGLPAPEPSPPDPRKAASAAGGEDIAPGSDGGDDDNLNLDDLGLDDLDLDTGGDDGGDLDDLLASFEDIDEDSGDDDGMDADLAALLDDL